MSQIPTFFCEKKGVASAGSEIEHPEFHEKTFIKVTLPALFDLSYDGLALADGDTAVAKYARMARGEIVDKL
jgi:hypothetical protein